MSRKIRTFSFSGLAVTTLAFVCIAYSEVTSQVPHPKQTCTNGQPAHARLAESTDPILQKLAEYETVCQGGVTDALMFFTAMPRTEDEAVTLAQNVATRLKVFAIHSITPLVSFEPSLLTPTILDDIKNGTYDSALSMYFQKLREQGITDKTIGTWILFPEANTPTWHNSDPKTFSANVTKVSRMLKTTFPNAHATVLLNSRTYAGSDTAWSHGALKSLLPYVVALPKGTVDSFGYQGFPSIAAANASVHYTQLDAKEFLPANLASEAASVLGTSHIWLNTGTFGNIHTDDPNKLVTLSPKERAEVTESIMEQAKQLQTTHTVSMNIFAKDKSGEDEHIDWSYWNKNTLTSNPYTNVLQTWLIRLHESDMEVSLYDSY